MKLYKQGGSLRSPPPPAAPYILETLFFGAIKFFFFSYSLVPENLVLMIAMLFENTYA